MNMLSPGDRFPDVTLDLAGGETLALPGALAGDFAIVLLFRGAWCPYCVAQLRAFSRAGDALAEVGARVVALSTEDEATTQEMVAKYKLAFPVGHGADADAVSAALGAFVNPEPRHLQSTGFVLAPDGNVIVSVYSSGAIGRLVPDDVVGMLKYVREHATS